MNVRLFREVLLLAAASGLLSGCALPGAMSAPTPYPEGYIPTVVYLTAEAIQSATHQAAPATKSPPATPTAASTLIPPTAPASETPTAGPAIPLAAIQFRAPGPMSRIVSPLQVSMVVIAGDSKVVEIDLYGEDGSRLFRRLVPVAGSPEGDPVSVKFPFQIRAAGEMGFLQVSTNDAHGRTQSLNTLPVLLLSSGSSQVNPAGNTIYERIVLPDLKPEAEVSGGTFELDGMILPYNRQQVVVDLLSDDGHSLATRLIPTTGTDWQSFDTTIPYKVDKPTPARLYFHQADDILDTPAYIYSQPLLLNP